MEPLSLTASIIAVVTAAGAVAKGLGKIKNLKDAPTELLALMTEVSDLQVVLEEVNEVVRVQIRNGDRLPMSLAQILLRAKNTLLKLNKLIQGPLTQSQKSAAGENKVARLVWIRERSNVRSLQEEVRDIKLNLTTVLSSGNAIGISRVNLRIHEISFITKEIRETQVKQYAETAVALSRQAEMLQEVCQALSMSTNIEALNPAATISESIMESFQTPRILHELDSVAQQPVRFLQSIRFNASRAAGTACKPFCSCICHAQYQFKLPRILSVAVGSLFMGYTGFPSIGSKCNEKSCSRRSKSVAEFSYFFPTWALTRGIVGRITPTPDLLLRLFRVIPSRSAIFHHAMLGDVEKIKDLFAKGLASPFDIAPSGSSSLHFALNSSRFAVCKLLLNSSADPFYESHQDSKPIDVAWDRILGGFESRATEQTLFDLFDEPDYLESRQFSMIHKIVLGILNVDLELVLEGSTSDIDRKDSSQRTPLLWAALRADKNAIRTLLRFNADRRSSDHFGKTALHYARDASSTKLLLAAQDSVDLQDIYGRTALHAACRRSPDLQRIRLLVEADADVDLADNWQRTPLSYAAQFNYPDVADYLICSGANLESRDVDGFTPLLTAIESNSHNVIKLLIDRGANLGGDSETILQTAIRSADPKTLKMLAEISPETIQSAPGTSINLAKGVRAVGKQLKEVNLEHDTGVAEFKSRIRIIVGTVQGHIHALIFSVFIVNSIIFFMYLR